MSATQEQQHLIAMFNNATEGIIITERNGEIMLANPAAERMFGYEHGEMLGKRVEVLIPAAYAKHHSELRQEFYQHPSNRVMGHGRDLFGQRKNGSLLPVEISLSYYRIGEVLHVIAFVIDITHRKQIEADMLRQQAELERISIEVKQLNAELEAKVEERTVILKEALEKLEHSQIELNEALKAEKQLNEIKSRFVSMASHEFRTPLSTVLSSASLLSKYRGGEEQDKRDRHIEKIKGSVKHLNDILEDFLSLGRLDEGKVRTDKKRFDLRQVVTDTIEEMHLMLKPGQRIELQYTAPDEIMTDPKMLKNILINLLSNAIKFSAAGSVVEVRIAATEGLVRMEVEDHGIGIPENDQPRLFSSFFRGANATNIQGTGLGLQIIKRYADLIGAAVSMRSVLGEGSVFIIDIPAGV
ncbi:MAG: PAS domain-containing sensor histidine kinase [Flavihumibacter sp.]